MGKWINFKEFTKEIFQETKSVINSLRISYKFLKT